MSERAQKIWKIAENSTSLDVSTLIALSPLLLDKTSMDRAFNPEQDLDPIFYLDHMQNFPQINLKSLDIKTKKQLTKLYIDHDTNALSQLVSLCNNAAELSALIKTVVWVNNHYPQIFGELEQQLTYHYGDADHWLKALCKNMHKPDIAKALVVKAFKKRMADLESRKIEPKHDKVLAQLNADHNRKTTVTEICSQLGLVELGARQRHCVGGYYSAIASGRSSIFEFLDRDGYRSTLEVALYDSDDMENRIVQHRSLRNSYPSAEHQAIAERLIALLNANITLI